MTQSLKEALESLVEDLPLVRDRDPRAARENDARKRRRQFLDEVCASKVFVFRRTTWPLNEIGVSVTEDGAWQVRVKYLAIDRDTKKLGQIEMTTEHADADAAHRGGSPIVRLAVAVKSAIVEAIEHEATESIYVCGERILDPHEGDV